MNDCLQIIFSGIVAISTVVYAVLTWKLVSETRETRKLQITPDIHAYFEKSEVDASFVYLIIENIGYGIAKNVKFQITKDFQYYDFEIQKLADKGAFKSGVKNFYSKQRFRYLFTDLSKKYDEKIKDNVKFLITYEDIYKKVFTKDLNLSLDEITGMGIITPPDSYLGRVAYELKEIRNILKTDKKSDKK